jgi:hypothetical protein
MASCGRLPWSTRRRRASDGPARRLLNLKKPPGAFSSRSGDSTRSENALKYRKYHSTFPEHALCGCRPALFEMARRRSTGRQGFVGPRPSSFAISSSSDSSPSREGTGGPATGCSGSAAATGCGSGWGACGFGVVRSDGVGVRAGQRMNAGGSPGCVSGEGFVVGFGVGGAPGWSVSAAGS